MEKTNFNKSVLKAISVIKSFTPIDFELSAADIARKVGIPLTTAHRTLATLTGSGLLEQSKKKGKYKIGLALYAIGNLYLTTTDIFKATKPVSEIISGLTSETVSLGIRDKGNVILVMREESEHALRLTRHIGSPLPAYASSMGKALLSELTEAEIDSLYPEEKLLPLTQKTIPTKKQLKLELEQIRKTGIAFNREESYEGVEAIASIIRNASGRAVAAIGIPVPILRLDKTKRERLVTLVSMGARLASHRLGYQDASNPVLGIQEIRSWWEQNKVD